MVGIIDYGAGNIRSVANALTALDLPWMVSREESALRDTSHLILPGVGEARSAMESLDGVGLIPWLRNVDKPFLGICLGMQLLFERSTERDTLCLGLIPGDIERFSGEGLRVPHMGWNSVAMHRDDPLFDGLRDDEYFYFVHSFRAPVVPESVGITEYGGSFTSAVRRGNFRGVQFHPEKSGAAGYRLLKNFVDRC